jgi:hypothetical protein
MSSMLNHSFVDLMDRADRVLVVQDGDDDEDEHDDEEAEEEGKHEESAGADGHGDHASEGEEKAAEEEEEEEEEKEWPRPAGVVESKHALDIVMVPVFMCSLVLSLSDCVHVNRC